MEDEVWPQLALKRPIDDNFADWESNELPHVLYKCGPARCRRALLSRSADGNFHSEPANCSVLAHNFCTRGARRAFVPRKYAHGSTPCSEHKSQRYL